MSTESQPDRLKVLIFDIETAPLLSHVWGARNDYIPADFFVHDSFMLTWAAKWWKDDKMMSAKLTSNEARTQNDLHLVGGLAKLMRQADFVVAHNVNRFDWPMVNNRLLLLREEPLVPVRTIDTLQLARANFRLASNKLDYLASMLGHGHKIKTDFDLWRDAYHGETKALKDMLTYNEHDVVILEKVFEDLLPYVRNFPRMVNGTRPEQKACPTCGNEDLKKWGKTHTNASTFQRYKCHNCGRYCRARSADKATKLSVHPL